MNYKEILYETRAPGVTTITLNRPDKLNAYTTTMCEELTDALQRYARNDDERILVLTGAGRAFCAGGDIPGDFEMEKARHRELGHAIVMREGMHPVSLALHRLDKPTIAMVNGPAIAGGLTLALLCDLRIASDRATLGDTSTTAGLLPDEGGAWLFPRFMGFDRAFHMVALGEKYDAGYAAEIGLITTVVPHDDLVSETMSLAEQLAGKAPLSLRLAKRMMRRGLESNFDSSLGDAELSVMITNDSGDAQEGMGAFLERRLPHFTGR